jgi:hypothetical protein
MRTQVQGQGEEAEVSTERPSAVLGVVGAVAARRWAMGLITALALWGAGCGGGDGGGTAGMDANAAGGTSAGGNPGAGGGGGAAGGVVGDGGAPGGGGGAAGSGGAGNTAGAGGAAACAGGATTRTVRIYVSGESIEERNRFVDRPFACDGKLNDRGGGEARNDNDEYGWMVPLAARLGLRSPGLAVEFVGASVWGGADESPYSGTYPSATPGHTSAIAGTDITAWLDEGSTDRGIPARRAELVQKTHCYDVAIAARGGNDLNHEAADGDYKSQLKELVRLLADGSSCKANPVVVVTAHLPDRADVAGQDRLFQRLSREAVDELKADTAIAADKRARIQHVDVYGAFKSNHTTTSMPAPAWFTGGAFDIATIGRDGDSAHPRRLASIYAGEVIADALDLVGLAGAP